jgi:hypothetical protein
MATTCPTTSSSTTSAPTTSNNMATTARMSTNSSREDFDDEAGRNTSTRTLVGDATERPPPMQTMKPSTAQTRLKRSMESVSSSDSSSSVTSTLSAFGEPTTKKKKTKRPPLEPTEKHLKIRAAVDTGAKWELDLEKVHGLTDEEACVVVSIATQNLSLEKFPPSLKGYNQDFVMLAREGWKHLKEINRLSELYPECGNQARVDGVWKMFRE